MGGPGLANLLVDSRRGRLCYLLSLNGTGRPREAHLHRRRAAGPGRLIADLDVPRNGGRACMRIRSSVLRSAERNPGAFLLDVHTGTHPRGAVRGGLVRAYGS